MSSSKKRLVSRAGGIVQLVLASTSRWRRKMLEDAGIRVIAVPPEVDERAIIEADPVALALTLAQAKADAVAPRYIENWVLGSDQVVTDDVEVWGKPEHPEDHLQRLLSMRGRTHRLISAFALWSPAENGERKLVREVEFTTLKVRADLEPDEMVRYVASGEGSGCAGGYAIEGQGAWLFERVDGDYFNILGLPLLKVITALRNGGWRLSGKPHEQ